MEIKSKKRLLIVFALMLCIAAFSGCELFTPIATDANLLGVWDAGGYSTWTFTQRGFSSDGKPAGTGGWDYNGYIVKAVDGRYNIAADSPSNSNCGYMVFRIIEHSGDAKQVGTHTVIRWRNKTTVNGKTTVEYSEAYPAGWATAGEAEAEAGSATHFTYFSTLTKIQ